MRIKSEAPRGNLLRQNGYEGQEARGNLLRRLALAKRFGEARRSLGYAGRVFARLGGAFGEAWAEPCDLSAEAIRAKEEATGLPGEGG